MFNKILIANRGDKVEDLVAKPNRMGTQSVSQASSTRER